MWFQILAYLNFLRQSTNQHGVHSPFVYQLVTTCFYNKKSRPAYQKIKAYRRDILQQHQPIHIQDFGAGSKVFSSGSRKVSAIAKNAGISYKRSKLLNRIVHFLHLKNIIELGTSVGLGTISMAAGNTIQIKTIEACPETAKIAQNTFSKHGFTGIQIIQKTFEEAFQEKLFDRLDLAYIDGNHQKEATINNFKQLLPYVHNDTIFILDDIYWSKEMQEAWLEIKKHPKVMVTIDTFQWGIIFFRKEQAKEHFTIRV